MSNWEDQRQHYIDELRLDEKSVEDRVARRVIRGIGVTNADKHIGLLELQVLGTAYTDQPLWPRAERLFRAFLSRNGKHKYRLDDWTIQLSEEKHEKAAMKRFMCMLEDGISFPLLMVMFADSKANQCYSLWDPADAAYFLYPPARILAMAGKFWIVGQEIEDFIKQFGPYYPE